MGKFMRIFGLTVILCFMLAAVAGAAGFKQGDKGSEVTKIQEQLASLGYDVSADGDYGAGTAKAVKAYQASHGMEVDGIVGPATYSALMGQDLPEVSRGSNYASRRIVSSALSYIGVPYVFGGSTPHGFDCSGFTRYVFEEAGVYLPRSADSQFEVGAPVSISELTTGDLVFFSTYEYGASHVGIYLDNGSFIHASSSMGVTIDELDSHYWGSCYIGARRVL